MKINTDPILKSAKDIEDFARKMIEDGRTIALTTFQKVPLLSALAVVEQKEAVERDETHYFLVPFKPAERDYALYSVRRLPEGYAPENDLPKLRVFHLPAIGAEKILEDLLLAQVKADKSALAAAPDTDLADRLNTIGNEIDKQTSRVSGGLMVIGGVVALANPLLGVGIAVKALLPGLAAKLSREGLRYGSDKLRKWQGDRHDAKLGKAAEKELKQSRAEMVHNPLLQTLALALDTDDEDLDPLTEFEPHAFHIDGYNNIEMLRLSAAAVLAVYQEILDKQTKHDSAQLGPEDLSWLKTLEEWANPR
jgi:hypothetical protein